MSLSAADKIFLVVGLMNFGGIFICLAVALHLAYTKMDFMLEHLKNCPAVMTQVPLRHGGLWGRLLLVGWISGVLTFPGYYLKRGGVSVEDLNNFPPPLKRKLKWIKWTSIALLAAMVFLFAIRKSELFR